MEAVTRSRQWDSVLVILPLLVVGQRLVDEQPQVKPAPQPQHLADEEAGNLLAFVGRDGGPGGGPAAPGDLQHERAELGVGRVVVERVDAALEGPQQFVVVEFAVGDADDAAPERHPHFSTALIREERDRRG